MIFKPIYLTKMNVPWTQFPNGKAQNNPKDIDMALRLITQSTNQTNQNSLSRTGCDTRSILKWKTAD